MTYNKIEKQRDQKQAEAPVLNKRQDKSKSNTNTLAVYLFQPCMTKRKITDDLDKFFTKDMDAIIASCLKQPVFLNIDSAIQYGRFISNHYVLIKAYVSETAIIGKSHALYLKNNSLNKAQIHGCYPSWVSGQVYFRNPRYYKSSDLLVSV